MVMSFAFRMNAAFALLIVGGSALQLTPDELRMCGQEASPYEAIIPNFPNTCFVFCVPAGTCEGEVQMGQMEYLHIRGPGNCKQNGFTDPAPLANMTKDMAKWLYQRQGPCKGMHMLKFVKPQSDLLQKKMAPSRAVCRDGLTPFEALSPHKSSCDRYCVPKGACESKAEMGELEIMGIIQPGDCIDKGYTEPAVLDNIATFTIGLFNNDDPCKGMELKRFTKTPMLLPKNAPQEENCGTDMTPFEARSDQSPDVCGLFCVPKGECEGQVRGRFDYLGIVGSGDCKSEGFTERATYGYASQTIVESLKYVYGPCRGLTYSRFTKLSQ